MCACVFVCVWCVFFFVCVCMCARVCEKFNDMWVKEVFFFVLPEVEQLDEVWCMGEDVGKHPEGLGWVIN